MSLSFLGATDSDLAPGKVEEVTVAATAATAARVSVRAVA